MCDLLEINGRISDCLTPFYPPGSEGDDCLNWRAIHSFNLSPPSLHCCPPTLPNATSLPPVLGELSNIFIENVEESVTEADTKERF